MKKLLKKWLQHSVLICILLGFTTSIVLFGLQSTGVLQGLELRAFDQQLLQRPELKIDDRITVIGETEPDIRRYGHPLSDQVFADAVQKLETEGTRVIGIDKYRGLGGGVSHLRKFFQSPFKPQPTNAHLHHLSEFGPKFAAPTRPSIQLLPPLTSQAGWCCAQSFIRCGLPPAYWSACTSRLQS